MSGWRFYAKRFRGPWLSTNVPIQGKVTHDLSGHGGFVGSIPAAVDEPLGEDGLPFWLERSTTLYAELDGELSNGGVYVCSRVAASDTGRELEFTGLTGALAGFPYTGHYTAWQPSPFDVIQDMLDKGQGLGYNAELGIVLNRVNAAPRGAGDPKPPEKPPKPGRRKGESKEAYDDRLLPWEMAVDEWDQLYGSAKKYELAWWEAPMIGAELDKLAKEVPFDYRPRHVWVDRDNLVPRHELVVGGHLGVRRDDLKLVDGLNMAEKPRPETDGERYANHVILLGAGEGADMIREAKYATEFDYRMLTARVVSDKTVTTDQRARAFADDELRKSVMSTTLDAVRVWDVGQFAPVSSLRPGDEVWVDSPRTFPAFAGWQRIASITRDTQDPVAEVRFVRQEVATNGG